MGKEMTTETGLIMPVTPEFIERRIHIIRGQKVMLDSDLAELYQVPTMRLNEQVKRNAKRFPDDFMLKLTMEEVKALNLSQFAIGSQKHRNPRFTPRAFTELGVAMLSSVLNSEKAIQMNIFILRAFMKLREMLSTHKDLAKKIGELERVQKLQGKDISDLIIAVSRLLESKRKLNSAIGFEM